ncbi:hypothetical protein CC80DRAFT_326567 [Byssothecium circinans]|uniref:Uncharacterized protein n=1 Tax=Byssothecium circinans TaxID=147558 RepID=A0A6A5U6B4_9PLEO|nr:hypothetical protein CC80DRAFT_326567 [Byssothecium circinans]
MSTKSLFVLLSLSFLAARHHFPHPLVSPRLKSPALSPSPKPHHERPGTHGLARTYASARHSPPPRTIFYSTPHHLPFHVHHISPSPVQPSPSSTPEPQNLKTTAPLKTSIKHTHPFIRSYMAHHASIPYNPHNPFIHSTRYKSSKQASRQASFGIPYPVSRPA